MVDDLRSHGSTPFTEIDTDRTLYRFGVFRTMTGTVTRIDREPVRLDVLVNGKVERLPAIHARATLADRGGTTNNVEFWVLDDRVNPLLLQWRSDVDHSRIIKIEYPVASRATEIETALEKGETIEVYGIYFDFGSASIRPQSTPVLEEIAAIMKRHADWSLDLAGFTDSIGNDADNLDLSKRRTAAVKTALVDRFGIAATRLETSGHGESSPKATNDTPEGRAQNRRVEITRRRSS
jgi:outer membrane protein OmpA-like peptidoglycan-associated protein